MAADGRALVMSLLWHGLFEVNGKNEKPITAVDGELQFSLPPSRDLSAFLAIYTAVEYTGSGVGLINPSRTDWKWDVGSESVISHSKQNKSTQFQAKLFFFFF